MNNKLFALSALTLAMTLSGTVHAAGDAKARSRAEPASPQINQPDPQRWYETDDTPRERYANLRKEATAAHGEAVAACRLMTGREMKQCRAQAHAALKDDVARARRIYEDYQDSLAHAR